MAVKNINAIQNPHACDKQTIIEKLETNPDSGLSPEQAKERLGKFGLNQLKEDYQQSAWSIFLSQFKSVIILIIALALAIAIILQKWPEAIAVATVILVNTLIGFIAEWKATKTISALQQEEEARVRVLRSGEEKHIDLRNVVPGDCLLIQQGEMVPADARVIQSENLRVNEASLTGESEPVAKNPDKVVEDQLLAERTNMLYKGCSVVGGQGKTIITSTGMQTELGKIAEAAVKAESNELPLRERLDDLGRKFVVLVFFSVIFVALAGWWRDRGLVEIIETAIALGIAAVPEGLPIVATIALAHGMWVMGKHKAIVKELQAVQALGSVPMLFTDKTGTLTRNHMELVRVVTFSHDQRLEKEEKKEEDVLEVIRIGVLCNGAKLNEEEGSSGDPMEVALLEAGESTGLSQQKLLDSMPQKRVVEFDRETMMMATFNKADDGLRVSVKGAPERVLKACAYNNNDEMSKDERSNWIERANDLAGEGYRLLAAASKTVDSSDEEPYQNLCFQGLFALEDTPREDVSKSIDECEDAGIKVVMVTGDKPETAEAVARQAGIGKRGENLHVISGSELQEENNDQLSQKVLEADIIARAEPTQKLKLIEAAQAEGEAVGMTGDGINDAPALKKASIGIAMGERGTDAAKQVADIILQDDSLATIVEAVKRGRTIMDNIRKAVIFFLCTNLAEIIALTIGTALTYPLPLLALQILYLNVITDVFPALALGVNPADQNVMRSRKKEAILTRGHWMAVGAWGILLAGATLGALIVAKEVLSLPDTAATTVSFLTLGFCKVWFPFNLRDEESPIFINEITRNRWIWGALLLCVGLLLTAVFFRPLGDLLRTEVISLSAWGIVLGFSLFTLLIGQIALVCYKIGLLKYLHRKQ